VPRLRQAVLAARDLDAAVERLRAEHGLGEPFADPAVAYFGLRNAVFAIGDQFLEVVSPVRDDASAARLLERRGGDCGYMAMFQVDDVAAARARARDAGVREVFEVGLDDMTEAHLHPADMRGAIVSVSQPAPPDSWRWGGPGWRERSVEGAIAGITVAVTDPEAVADRWAGVLGSTPEVEFVAGESEPGIVAIQVELSGERATIAP
jgi:hypothetical protein